MNDQRSARASTLEAESFRPAGPRPGFVGGTVQSVRDIWGHRELLGLLTRREIKARYKDSVLGFFWSLARPLAMLMVYWVAIGKFLGAERAIPEFAIYIFTGLTAWQLFSDIVLSGTGSIVANSGLIKKVYVPREVYPLSAVGSALFNFVIQLGILIAFTVVRGQFPLGARWLYFVLAVAVLVTFATAVALFLSAVNVYLRDVQYLVDISLMLLFWASPIVYSWSQVSQYLDGILETIYLANPMTQVVLAFQQTFWVAGDGQPVPENLGTNLLITLGISVVLLWLGQRTFARLQSNFAQEL
ncbi:ABC transporter permease [Cellulosimicrobium sp. Marseille-Q8652]